MEDDIFGAVIYSYTRAQAIEDTVLIDLSQAYPEEARVYKYPVACTAAVWAIIEAAVAAGIGNSFKGVVGDLLNMSQQGIVHRIDPTQHLFRVIITGAGPKKVYTFKAVCGPGDELEPVITILLPEED